MSNKQKQKPRIQDEFHKNDIKRLNNCSDIAMLSKKVETYVRLVNILKARHTGLKGEAKRFTEEQIARYEELIEIATSKINEVEAHHGNY